MFVLFFWVELIRGRLTLPQPQNLYSQRWRIFDPYHSRLVRVAYKWATTYPQMSHHISKNEPLNLRKWALYSSPNWATTSSQMCHHISPNEPPHFRQKGHVKFFFRTYTIRTKISKFQEKFVGLDWYWVNIYFLN